MEGKVMQESIQNREPNRNADTITVTRGKNTTLRFMRKKGVSSVCTRISLIPLLLQPSYVYELEED